jgi:hypothetical protein
MNLNDLANAVASKADTKGTAITVAEVKRVQSLLFGVLAKLPAAEAMALIARGLARHTGEK